MNTNYSTLSGAPTVTYLVYDNATPVNYNTNWDANGDGKVWVQTTTTYQGRSTRVRVLVRLVDEGVDTPQGRTVLRQRHHSRRHERHLRREP